MAQVIKSIRFEFTSKTLSLAKALEFDNEVSSAVVAMSGFQQQFSDGQNIKNASVHVTITDIDKNLVDLKAVLDIQPTNDKSREGWIEAVVIAEVA